MAFPHPTIHNNTPDTHTHPHVRTHTTQLRLPGRGPTTTLKYALETRLPHTTRLLGFLEPLLERVVYEDIPANLAAVKARVELMQVEAKARALEEAGVCVFVECVECVQCVECVHVVWGVGGMWGVCVGRRGI